MSRYRPARTCWAGTKELPPTSCAYRSTYIRRHMASLPQQVPRSLDYYLDYLVWRLTCCRAAVRLLLESTLGRVCSPQRHRTRRCSRYLPRRCPQARIRQEVSTSLWRLQTATLRLTYKAGPDRRPGAFKVRCQARTGGSSSLERELEEAQPQGSLSRCRLMRRHGLISPATQHSQRAQDQYADDTR